MAAQLPAAVIIGLGATLIMDLWAVLLKRVLGIPAANYCLVGRWLCHMPGKFRHANINKTPPHPSECWVGWSAHYATGVVYAVLFVAIAGDGWLQQPAVLPALSFGVVTVLAPFLIMHPAFGFGIAAAKAPNPAQARIRSGLAHLSFGAGLYISAVVVAISPFMARLS